VLEVLLMNNPKIMLPAMVAGLLLAATVFAAPQEVGPTKVTSGTLNRADAYKLAMAE
jgi:hypothetical protein